MRPIKFRGFACDNGDEKRWVHGHLTFEGYIGVVTPFSEKGEYDTPVIVYYDKEVGWYSNHVHEKSVGQFTGAYDPENNEIYEGDILQRRDGNIYAVEWDDYDYEWILRDSEGWIFHTLGDAMNDLDSYRVIGNMFENKKLMEGGEG